MSYVTWKIERTPFVNGAWDNDSTEVLPTPRDIILDIGLGTTKDSFDFKITNIHNYYDNYFNIGDKISIYRSSNTALVTTNNLLMIGTTKDLPNSITYQKNNVHLKGFNYSEAVTSAIAFADVDGLTIPEAIKLALSNAGEKNTNFQVVWHPDNPLLKQNGDSFPTVSERWFNKTVKDLIEKYSVDSRTNDGNYFWYIDHQNRLIWRPELLTKQHSFNYNTSNFKTYVDSRDISQVKNFIILKGGLDPANKQIQTRYISWTSVQKHGIKYYFLVSDINGAKELVNQDITRDYGPEQTTISYPNITLDAYTTKWKSNYNYTTTNYSINVTKGNPVSINKGSESQNKKAYTELIRTEVTKRLYDLGQKFAESRDAGKLKIDIGFAAGVTNWKLGELIECNIPNSSDTIKKLRVANIQYATDVDTFSLEEDIGSE